MSVKRTVISFLLFSIGNYKLNIYKKKIDKTGVYFFLRSQQINVDISQYQSEY